MATCESAIGEPVRHREIGVGAKVPGVNRIEAPALRHEDAETRRELLNDGGMQDVQSTGIGAEGRQEQASRAKQEAAPAQQSARERHQRHRMEMAEDDVLRSLVGRRVAAIREIMPEGEVGDGNGRRRYAADDIGQDRIVIAGDPNPIKIARQLLQSREIAEIETGARGAIVKAVAKADHPARPVSSDDAGDIR